MAQDKYFKLRVPEPTPADEICRCVDAPPITLMGGTFGFNPIHCLNCNLEVPPETFNLSSVQIDGIAYWRVLHDAISLLWLDSGEYEEWVVSLN